jgi:cellulose synthase/poly-beta-1,6-N-acetylglucosamine synthase-like glycosyltransferase
MISVLTATLGRRPAMLVEAVESVRAQTFADWEHIVVDDGSFRVPCIDGVDVVHVTQRGLGPARNIGLERARGEAIALLDDDDVWLPHHLETVWDEMLRTGADVVYADCTEVGRRDGHHVQVRPFDGSLLAAENFICVPATLVRTSSLRRVGGFPTGSLEDWSLWKAMLAAGMRFSFVPEKTVLYRFHTDNLTYGGVDPSRTATARDLLDRAMNGQIGWEEYEERTAEVWR